MEQKAARWEKIGERGQWVLRGLIVVLLLLQGASLGGWVGVLCVLGAFGLLYCCWWWAGRVRYPSIVYLIVAAMAALLMAAMR